MKRCLLSSGARQRGQLAVLVTKDVIAEHRAAPVGDHSPALSALLVALRQAPVRGKLALLETVSGKEWVIIRLSGEPGVPHRVDGARRYSSLDRALHAVFMQRLADLGLLDEHGEVVSGGVT